MYETSTPSINHTVTQIDTVMSWQAGVAIESSLWLPIFTVVNRILLAITPIIAQLTLT